MTDRSISVTSRQDPIAVRGIVNLTHPARDLRQWRKDSEAWMASLQLEIDDMLGEVEFHQGQIDRINGELDRRGVRR